MSSSPPAEPTLETPTEPQETVEESAQEITVEPQVETTDTTTTTNTAADAEDTVEQEIEPELKRDVIIEEYGSSQRQVNDLIASLRLDLLTSRSEVASLKSKVNSLTAQNIDLTIRNQGVTSSETAHKLQMEQMEARLNDLKQKESDYRRQLAEMENERNLIKDLKQKQYQEHASESSTLLQERDDLTQKNSDLRLEVAKGRTEIDVIKAEKKALQLRCDELELSQMGASKAHEDLIAIYEKQQKDTETQLDNAIAAEARARQDAKSIEEQLRKENDDLQQKLVECQDRLSVVRKDGPPVSEGKHSNLIQLMREYEKGGKKWEYIYEDYFELRDAHVKTVSQCENMRANIEKLMRQQRDKEQRYHRMETELARVQADTEAVRERARQSEAAQSENDKVVNGLNRKIHELQRNNNELKQSLHDTAYQLRYIIRDVELRNEVLPPEVQSSNDLLKYASLTPEFSHEDLVFKNVAELQEQNQALLQRIRKLNEEVKEKSDTVEQLRRDGQEVEEKYTQAIRQAQETITDLNHSVSSLERRLSTAIKQRDMYKLGLSDEQSTQQASAPDTTQPTTDEGEDEDEAYRYAMQQDMQQLQTELQEAQSAASASNAQLKTTEAEIENLRRECQSLLAVQATRATEIKELRTRNIELEQLLANNEQRYAQRNQDIIASREKENVLRTENATLRVQLDFSDTLHKNALQENESLSAQCAQLTSLIKTMTSTSTDNSQLEGIDFLKKQIEAQDQELEGLRLKLENAQQSMSDSQGLEQDHWKNKYSEVHRELENLNTKQLELQKELSAAKEQRIGLETKLALLEKKQEEDKPEEQQDTTFETRYTELAAANMEVDKLRIQITDYQDQLDKQRQAAVELEKEHDAFTTDMQAKLAKVHQDLSDRDSMIQAAQTATADIQRLKLERAEAEQQWNAAKEALNAEKDALQQRVKEYEEEAARLRQQIETQTELINECKEKLDQEINSHSGDAEKIKTLQEESARLNEEYTSAKAELSTLQTQLQTSEESWNKQKEQWEASESRMKAELENSNKRFADLIDNLPSGTPADVSNKSDEQLKEMSIQLNQKNEILQQQYKVAVVQADKLRTDLGFCQKQMATLQAQVKSIQEQNEAMEKKYAVAQQEAKNEAVVYKENNTHLRITISELRNKLAVTEKEVSESKDAIQPLSNKVLTLESKIKAQTETIASLEKSKQEWSTRTAQIMSKYNKLDPAEIEAVKQERDALKAQLENIDTTKSDSDTKLKEIEAEKAKIEKELEDLKQRVPKLQNAAAVFKKRWEQAQEKAKAEVPESSSTVDEEKKSLEAKIKELNEEKEKVEASLKQRITAHQELQKKHQSLLAKSRQIVAEKAKIIEEHKQCEQKLKDLQDQLDQQKAENGKVQEELKACLEQKKTLETEQARTKVKLSVDANKIAKLNKELESLKRARTEDSQEGAPAAKVQKQETTE